MVRAIEHQVAPSTPSAIENEGIAGGVYIRCPGEF